MITELLAALSAIPKIANSLDRLAGTLTQINARAAKARAAKRRGDKADGLFLVRHGSLTLRPSRREFKFAHLRWGE